MWLGALGIGLDNTLAVVEYSGEFTGLQLHGNSWTNDRQYVRTDPDLMDKMTNMLEQQAKPKKVYDRLVMETDEITGPTGPKQVHDKKRHDRQKKDKENGQTIHRKNVADHVRELQNRTTAHDTFVQFVGYSSGKSPCVVLYTDEQLLDIQTLCCTGRTILGIDKTFNLCDMHVTVTCFKQLSVEKDTTNDPPLFIGPLFLHDNSDKATYDIFFSRLKSKLTDVDTTKLVIGTDDERAMVKSIVDIFPRSTHILCTRHLRENTLHRLKDDRVDKHDRQAILDKIFGEEGLLNVDDTICYEEKCDELQAFCQSRAPKFKTYFDKRLKNTLNEKVSVPERIGQIDKGWTNNNCESINHVLKQAIDWKSKTLTDLVDIVHDKIKVQYKELRRALVGTGQYRLADTHQQFHVNRMVWASKTNTERQKLYLKFRKYVVTDRRLLTTSDGTATIIGPRTLGKKIGQVKRKVTARTTTLPKKPKF